ncbi:MAG TPA: hypothetical protein VJ438_06000 [Candidatus Nanoarchaeia archaeon]|nr:hypothetical protein [Candidatus Nanoarchaeia archaeon]
MTKGRFKFWFLIFIIILTSFSIGLLMRSPNQCIQIPNHQMIQEFCKDNNFESGWLSSSSCGLNEVMCHRKIGNLDENKCLRWDYEE